MPVLPELRPMLERIAAARAQQAVPPSLAEQRAMIAAQQPMRLRLVAPAPKADRAEHRVPVPGGEIAVRVFTPPGADGPLPVHLHVHGGGWWLGSHEPHDVACARLAVDAGCAVVSPDHRLAPEHPFPAPAEDVYATLLWTVEHAAGLGVDPGRVSVGGVSSGGNLAAAAALMARDRGGPALAAQLLEVAPLDLTLTALADVGPVPGLPLTREDMARYVARYAAGAPREHPYLSPLRAGDLSGLPPARIMTAEYDLLRDDGERYAARLAEAGVPAAVTRWAGHLHGSHEMTALLRSAREWQALNAEFLRERLRR
ncbi:alpha/beta hydrolase [Actinomadura kijaniata]|uniref:Acetyl esterase n=1 Tax=Actinomadura namibiensis TaxID=182080 RepID=A0A7W3QLK5_ACTNM|nr:alpha/beta hydrolase [Actinomadura namibiensis]MBA8951103.1 acetyl esterase [Actinomadura namibiensis]